MTLSRVRVRIHPNPKLTKLYDQFDSHPKLTSPRTRRVHAFSLPFYLVGSGMSNGPAQNIFFSSLASLNIKVSTMRPAYYYQRLRVRDESSCKREGEGED